LSFMRLPYVAAASHAMAAWCPDSEVRNSNLPRDYCGLLDRHTSRLSAAAWQGAARGLFASLD